MEVIEFCRLSHLHRESIKRNEPNLDMHILYTTIRIRIRGLIILLELFVTWDGNLSVKKGN